MTPPEDNGIEAKMIELEQTMQMDREKHEAEMAMMEEKFLLEQDLKAQQGAIAAKAQESQIQNDRIATITGANNAEAKPAAKPTSKEKA